MPKPRKGVTYNATDEAIREYFMLGCEIDKQQKVARAELSEFNKQAEQSGVHSGALALARRIKRLSMERRRLALRETARVLVVLEDLMLEEETATNGETPAKVARPFEQRPAA